MASRSSRFVRVSVLVAREKMNQEENIRLIQCYKNHSILWDPKYRAHYSRAKREIEWQKISTIFQKPVSCLKARMRTLMGSYRSERSRENKRRIQALEQENKSDDDAYKSKWFAYKHFDFLKDKYNTNTISDAVRSDSQEVATEVISDTPSAATSSSSALKTTFRTPTPTEQENQALQILPSSASESDDPHFTCALNLADELRKYDAQTVAPVKTAFANVLIEAELGRMSSEPTTSCDCDLHPQQDTPASTQSSSENETQVSIKIEETPSEDFYQDDEGDASEAEDVKMDDLDIADTRIILHEVEPLNVQYAPPKECDLFGEYVATHLQKLPVHVALKLQSGIQALVTQTRLEYIREHPSEAPLMVQEETPEEADSPEKPSNTNIPASDNPQQSRSVKRVQETDQHGSKRFKLDSCDRSDALPTQDRQNQNKRTECMVFAEHIALQLEQLPEETSLRLQSDIYAMIMQAYLQSVDDDAPNRVKIKSEPDLRTLNQC